MNKIKLDLLRKTNLVSDDYFFKSLTDVDVYGDNVLMKIFLEDININNSELDYLIKNSDLRQVNNNGWNSLMFILDFYKDNKLKLDNEQWLYLINNSNLLQMDDDNSDDDKSRSVVGLIIENKPKLIELVFQKIINNKKFKLKNYKTDINYSKIVKILDIFSDKKKIGDSIKIKNGKIKINKI